jgi:predicted DsbA family dithiol-disulfide isomerase
MALENPHITADAVQINEYPHLAQRYRVMGVPKTMINGREGIEGALPEQAFVSAILLQATQPHESS